MSISFTYKQTAILKAIKDKRDDGEFCDIYDIMKVLSYEVKRDALLHSIKILIDAGYVQRLPREKRGKVSVRPFTVTASGFASV